MTSNGVQAPQNEEAEAVTPEPELEAPKLEVTSLDYWREMTQRQIERLQREIKALEDAATPLRSQLTVLQQALRSVQASSKPGTGSGRRGLDLTPEDRQVIWEMVAKPSWQTADVRAALPHVKDSQLYSAIYAARDKQAKLKQAQLKQAQQ